MLYHRRDEAAPAEPSRPPGRHRGRLAPPRAAGALALGLGLPLAAIGAAGPVGASGAARAVYGFGANEAGQLGTGKPADADSPRPVEAPAGVTFGAVAAGGEHSVALGSNGKVYAWGSGTFGQLGDGGNASSPTPVAVSLPTGAYTAVSAGADSSYALTASGRLYAWGLGTDGELGDGNEGSGADATIPTAVTMPGGVTFTAVSAGDFHVLALGSNGDVYAFGDDNAGQLGQGADGPPDGTTPVAVAPPVGEHFTAVAAGGSHSLALTSAGTVEAWGSGGSGQLGDGGEADSAVPTLVCAPGATAPCTVAAQNVLTVVTAIAAGNATSEAIVNGHVEDWGDNDLGQLGVGAQASCDDGTALCSAVPVSPFLPPAVTVTAIAAGFAQGYALTATGAVWGWGDDYYGQLGNGASATNEFVPVSIPVPSGATVGQVVSGPAASFGFVVSGVPLAQSLTFPQTVKESTSTDFIPAVSNSGATPSVSAGPPAVCSANALPAGTVNFNGQVGTCVVTAQVPAGTYGGVAYAAAGPATADITVLGPEPYVPIAPVRVLDTRPVTGPIGVPTAAPVGDEQTITLHVAGATVGGQVPVPADATSVVLNVTVTGPTAGSYLQVWPAGAPQPTSSNLNFVAGETVPNLVQVGVGTGGDIEIYNWGGSTNVVADVEGYSAPTAAGSSYTPLPPSRILDTRPVTGPVGVTTAAPVGQTPIHLLVDGAGGVPGLGRGVSAVVLNVTVTSPTTSSWLTVWPDDGGSEPTASNLNFVDGETVPNRVIATVGPNGMVNLAVAAGTAEVVADVSGYFSSDTAGADFVPAVAPLRLVDTRSGKPDPTPNCYGGNTLNADAPLVVAGSGTAQGVVAACNGVSTGIPAAAVALVANVTVTDPSTASWVTVWPTGQPLPASSDLNYVRGEDGPQPRRDHPGQRRRRAGEVLDHPQLGHHRRHRRRGRVVRPRQRLSLSAGVTRPLSPCRPSLRRGSTRPAPGGTGGPRRRSRRAGPARPARGQQGIG